MSFCRRTVEDRLPLERVPLACTFGSPLDLHVRQSLGLQSPMDLDHHRVELLIAHQQWFPMVVHNLTVHPGVMWLVQSEPDLLVAGPRPLWSALLQLIAVLRSQWRPADSVLAL